MKRALVFQDGHVVHLIKSRTTIGRRPYNDIILDSPGVSGEHAAVELTSSGVWLVDLGSTNGTFVNAERIGKRLLRDLDEIDFANLALQYVEDQAHSEDAAATASGTPEGVIRVLTGAATGRDVPLLKPVTTMGKAGVSVAAITRRSTCYTVAHVDGRPTLTVNGTTVGPQPLQLRNGDLLTLAGTQMMFLQDVKAESVPGRD